jgi:CHAT domain-containing protein
LLAYSAAEKKVTLFVLHSPGSVAASQTAFRLAIATRALAEEIRELRRLLSNPRSDRARIRTLQRRLYGLLIAPAESLLKACDRILIAPDGPLHYLPFAALMRPDGKYLVEWKPIHTVISATVYAELKKMRHPPEDPSRMEVAAFGDPSYPGLSAERPEEVSDLRVRSALRRGLPLTPLPSSRREVEALGALYPHAEIYLGTEATEERAKALGKGVRIVHFAGHALLDEELPLNSSLALSIPESRLPGQEDGLLQSWEIFEQMRLDADLVTLSACKTALGKEMGGEGLVGLTRAFQVAGARSILASLWSIGDRSTAQFMPRFYQHLRAGLTKDEALRRTQIEWIKNPKTSHPFHWAAFELIGDYQ